MKRGRISWCGTVLILAALLAAHPAAVAADGERVRLDAPCGPMAGVSKNGVAAFKGIPYARPPIGDLRFAPPAEQLALAL